MSIYHIKVTVFRENRYGFLQGRIWMFLLKYLYCVDYIFKAK